MGGGEVVSAEVLTRPDGSSKGCGIVEYVDQATAAASIPKMVETQLHGRPITVRADRPPGDQRAGGGHGSHAGPDVYGGDDRGGYPRGGGGGLLLDRPTGPPRGSSTVGPMTDPVVLVRGMPWKATERDVEDFFGPACPPIRGGVRFIRNPDGRASGDGFVIFASVPEAEQALSKHRQHMGPRYVEIYPSSLRDMETALPRSGYAEGPPPRGAAGGSGRYGEYDRGGHGYDDYRGRGYGGRDMYEPGVRGEMMRGGGGGWGDHGAGGAYGGRAGDYYGGPPRDYYDREDERRRYRREGDGRMYDRRDNSPPRRR
eukprot:SAG31_NODE_4996_length_2814_cov_1.124125_1_plen_314_part_00